MSCAKMGNRAVADAKKVAKKSKSIDDLIRGRLNTKTMPSQAARNVTAERSEFGRNGTSRIASSDAIKTRKLPASTTYTQPMLVFAISTPANIGPSTDAA